MKPQKRAVPLVNIFTTLRIVFTISPSYFMILLSFHCWIKFVVPDFTFRYCTNENHPGGCKCSKIECSKNVRKSTRECSKTFEHLQLFVAIDQNPVLIIRTLNKCSKEDPPKKWIVLFKKIYFKKTYFWGDPPAVEF